MVLKFPLFSLIITVLLILGCSNKESDQEYDASINHWHQLRIDSLKGETGFLNLAGLYWFEQSINSFGSDSTNEFVFPPKSPPFMGSFLVEDSLVYLIPSSPIMIGGKVIADTTLVFDGSIAPKMAYQSLHWFIIKRGQHVGVRLRDFKHPLLQNFDTIDYFDTHKDWRVKATWTEYEKPKQVPFSNVLGMSIEYKINGVFSFEIDGNQLELEPLGEPEPEGYFVMFYDKTSGHTTYGSGRYLYVAPPNEDGETIIDFNKAYNPPCAFTEFATCLFPHKKNRLPIFVEAGEKFSGH